jgi:hypothetical protein
LQKSGGPKLLDLNSIGTAPRTLPRSSETTLIDRARKGSVSKTGWVFCRRKMCVEVPGVQPITKGIVGDCAVNIFSMRRRGMSG